MRIGIPKQILPEEKRVAATPETLRKYVKMGFCVTIQAAAEDGIYVGDDDYRKAGATIVPSAGELFATSDVVLKVKQSVFNANAQKHEAEMLQEGSILITPFLDCTDSKWDSVERSSINAEHGTILWTRGATKSSETPRHWMESCPRREEPWAFLGFSSVKAIDMLTFPVYQSAFVTPSFQELGHLSGSAK